MAALGLVHHLPGEQPAAVDHAPQVHVQHLLPVLHGGVQQRAGQADAGVIDDHVRGAQLLVHVARQRLHGAAVADVGLAAQGLAAGVLDFARGARGGIRINVGAQHGGAPGAERQRRLLADAGTGAGDHHQLAAVRSVGGGHPGPLQGRVRRRPFNMIDKGFQIAGGQRCVAQQRAPVAGVQFPAPQLAGPGRHAVQQRRAHIAVAARHQQLHRHRGAPLPGIQQARQHVGAVERHALGAVTGLGGADRRAQAFGAPQQVGPGVTEAQLPGHRRQGGDMKSADVPALRQLPQAGRQIGGAGAAHAVPDMVQAGPGQAGVGGDALFRPRLGDRFPGLDRAPVVAHQVHRPARAQGIDHREQIVAQFFQAVGLAAARRGRGAGAAHVIGDQEVVVAEGFRHRVPDVAVIRVAVDEQHRRAVRVAPPPGRQVDAVPNHGTVMPLFHASVSRRIRFGKNVYTV